MSDKTVVELEAELAGFKDALKEKIKAVRDSAKKELSYLRTLLKARKKFEAQ